MNNNIIINSNIDTFINSNVSILNYNSNVLIISNASVNATVPIEDTIYISNDKTNYSILNQINITPKNTNYFVLNTPYCFETFSITNPYNMTFFISLGNFTFPKFTNDIKNNVATFDLSDYNDIIPHTGPNLYIDNNIYKRVQIMYSNNPSSYINMNPNYVDITVTGFEIVNNVQTPINKVIRKYFTSYTLPLNAPTDSIDIYGSCLIDKYNNPNNIINNYSIEISLNNVLYNVIEITPNDNNKLLRCKFSNLDGIYKEGNENNYLSPSINSNTINCSQLQFIDIVFINFKPANILQNVYTAYSYPERQPIFKYN
jgi:hypothetical protein